MYKTYPFTLEDLPYAYDALEPIIDVKTMEIHHGKHHQAYVDNLNKALEERKELQDKTLEELITSDVDVVKNNAGGVLNHDFFWRAMVKPDTSHIGDKLTSALEEEFKSVDAFFSMFEQIALGRFGSGWAWLVKDKNGKLELVSTPNQDSPLLTGKKPLLGLDVWEHAYYLKYQNRRADYAKAWWSVVNWDRVEELWGA
ncbi:MAG: Superoxide dismutase [Candidatus Collierbacteria bacterium GW2011_GWC1_45_47]|uniref:Superoxide dismutase n=4 Tax=Candidatus Collieribacteriota TaxID=1752725 RepID=A0A0G1P825_9BACT|nr:MAG: Superoxide dismutase [Candidatus Collierbacteria bacterium GW2011_GWA1_44_12]KKT38104.1 MAG: Superoxide dismutase [Candidatus Collierbacteria bacterium GW2011_GWF1_44_12]KKT98860.1 MAG: Superoxide dismutase [Candidatus Collierbacteria bacterium GW2011_GWC2_45_15]KKU09745.1 MAG: Superoxide dismutase [Candidatus Collierbacteria bacterium GW2011_GWC1_45_47]KKU29044.1 MAG: Superoxide dismutase [Candidatus Collierbacteria bacterium GW2011_GWE1_46_18]